MLNPSKGEFELKAWKNIHVGEVVRVNEDKFCPADLLLLSSSDPKGVCYVETKNLDGETNLKIKNVHKDFGKFYNDLNGVTRIDGTLMCERPNGALYKFEGQALIS